MTAARRQNLSSVILHEMSHQWFGDLVTMRWWNGLWLNESFASYMATLGSAKSGEFAHPWLSQYRSKQGAYRTDESIATHPIEVPVPSTANAFDNIDAITYTKGAATLHQLRQMIGDETFRRGVHDYLVAYAWKNATLDDFIGALSKAAGRDLQPWAQEWLYKPGVDVLSADFECADGKLSRFTLRQAAANAAYPTLRTQQVQVATFAVVDGRLALAEKVPVTYAGAATAVPALVGKACPALVYPNYEDWGFAKVSLDERSFATARAHLTDTDDVMLRSMLWQSLSDGLRERRVALPDYIDAVLANIGRETDYTLVRQALGYLATAQDLLRIYGNDSPAARRYAEGAARRIEDALWTGTLANASQRDKVRSWFSTWMEAAHTPAGIARLRELLDGKTTVPGMELDQETRWGLIYELNRYDAPGSEALIAAELARDNSEDGELSALASRVARPDARVKAEWLAKVQALPTDELPYAKLRTVMGSLYPSGQEALASASLQQRYDTLAAIDAKADRVFMSSYAGSMLGGTCSQDSVQRLKAILAAKPTIAQGTWRDLESSLESDERCLAIRNKFADSLKH
jgi:aminopeptidase N